MAVEITDRLIMDKNRKQLKENFDKACNDYLEAFCKKQGFSSFYWVADRVGEIADCNECFTFNFDDIRADIDTDAPAQEIVDWNDYCAEAELIGLATPDYRHWLQGCPRADKQTIDKLKEMRQELFDEIERINKELKKKEKLF